MTPTMAANSSSQKSGPVGRESSLEVRGLTERTPLVGHVQGAVQVHGSTGIFILVQVVVVV